MGLLWRMSWRSSRGRAAARPDVHRCCSFTGRRMGAWCWAEHFLDFFADRGFDAYALSLRGHGRSGGQALAHGDRVQGAGRRSDGRDRQSTRPAGVSA